MKIKRLILCLLCCACFIQTIAARESSAALFIPQTIETPKAKVDLRVELMSIVARLAEYEEYSGSDFKLYVEDVNRHFANYKQHPAIEFARKIRKSNGVGFDAVMKMAVHLDPPPALTPRIPFTTEVPDQRWGREQAEEFVKLLQQFYKDAGCEAFFQAHASLYRTAEGRFQQVLSKVDFGWYKQFYGEVPQGSFNLYIGLLNGGGNYGPKVVHPDGKEDLYAILGTWQTDKEGLPLYDDKFLSTIIHEYNHSFINHLVYAREAQLRAAGEKVHPPVAESMKRLAYGSWQVMMLESLVRAAVVRYLADHENTPEAFDNAIIAERNIGFLWMDELVTLLGVYENSRAAYPTFRSFMPLIEGYYTDLAKRIDYKVKRFDDMRPRVIALSPITNNAEEIDPAVTRLTFTFDRPLEPKRYSINYGQGGEEHFPIEKVIGFNESGTSFTVQVKLKPDWQYDFVLTGQAFRTRDGYPLQSYTVKFKTKKSAD